ncbi:MAG: CocE/NonD family hydrolase, partial [Proteobacteria bacterium]|nr:CocE/NonD family hydrolase [Pseudomonadota bacterium]
MTIRTGAPLRALALALALVVGAPALAAAPEPAPLYPGYPSETPAEFRPVTAGFDYVRREEMIPMRDGVRLHTVILVPKGARQAPILLTRTPYNADEQTSYHASAHLGPLLNGYDNPLYTILEGGYVRVVQDVRGKYGSEGDFVMNRPPSGHQNPTPVDESTDCYDTIEWLVHHTPESNGRVAVLGISYDGFLPLMALIHPHPALKAAVPMNPMVDGWMGDDWFHYGAFRQINLPYIHDQVATRDNKQKWWSTHLDDYEQYLAAGSAGELARRHGLEQLGFWTKLHAHPAYDAFWQDQAVDRQLAAEPLAVPVLLVHGLWDQEDIYGAQAVYRALKDRADARGRLFLVIGPWYHGQQIEDGNALGPIRFGMDTSLYFQRQILRPFLDRYLRDAAPAAELAPVTAFETGTNAWRQLPAWPAGCSAGCPPETRPLYLGAGGRAGFAAPAAGEGAFDEYVSDPAKPVPYRARPIQAVGYGPGTNWVRWLVDDQREASGRTDVLSYVTEVLTAPVKIAGSPVARLVASTSGTDSDWVVKLIDVYPDEVADQPELGGYQLMVAADIFRGRYRESFEHPKALAPGKPLEY